MRTCREPLKAVQIVRFDPLAPGQKLNTGIPASFLLLRSLSKTAKQGATSDRSTTEVRRSYKSVVRVQLLPVRPGGHSTKLIACKTRTKEASNGTNHRSEHTSGYSHRHHGAGCGGGEKGDRELLTKRLQADDDVLYVLDHAETERADDGTSILRLSGQLDRKLYERVNKMLEALGGKWDRKAKGHVFAAGRNPSSALMALIDTGEMEVEKLDFFPTPPEIAEQMIELADIPENTIVLEPSAGEGAICDALKKRGMWPHACELDARRVSILESKGYRVVGRDFLSFLGSYSHILMNPPFSSQRDIAHVMHAYDSLWTGGRLVSVMAESVFFRSDKKSVAFREFLGAYGYDVELPAGAFKASGTSVKTRLIVLNK